MFAVTMFFACESNFKDVQNINTTEFNPVGEADNVNLKYTDSGKIKAILVSKKMLDYSNASFPFTEFPVGVDVTLYDVKAAKSFVRSDYAITYSKSNIIDLRGKVKITNPNGDKMETEQLYYDQKNEWFFTEKKFKFTSQKGEVYGEGVDFNKDFSIVNTQTFSGQIEKSEE